MNKKALFAIVVTGICICAFGYMYYAKHTKVTLPTYFSYTEQELKDLPTKNSSRTLLSADIFQTDKVMFDLIAKNTKDPDFKEDPSKIYAYLAVAERDFAYLSYNVTGKFSGTFDPLSRELLCVFFKKDCENLTAHSFAATDPYSVAVAGLVMEKVKARMAEDAAGKRESVGKEGEQYWNGPQPWRGKSAASFKGWFIASGSQFRSDVPPAYTSKEFQDQVLLTKERSQNLTGEQKYAIVFWAGGSGTKSPAGQILELADSYMQEQRVELEKLVLVRSVLALAIADANTTAYESKYEYLVKRPFMMDASIKPVLPTPNSPSYPGGHSALSFAGATVLSHYFPENKTVWSAKAEEAGQSRIWEGIHYMMDHEAGKVIGQKVAEEAIRQTNESAIAKK